jgi:hypothetical protein
MKTKFNWCDLDFVMMEIKFKKDDENNLILRLKKEKIELKFIVKLFLFVQNVIVYALVL